MEGMCMIDQRDSPVLLSLWSYVKGKSLFEIIFLKNKKKLHVLFGPSGGCITRY
jgi:hypothetical protein